MTVVRPILEYASPVWDSCTKADALALERLQLSVARALVKKGRRVASNSAVLEMIGWPTLAWRKTTFKVSPAVETDAWSWATSSGGHSCQPVFSVRAKQSLRRDTLAMASDTAKIAVFPAINCCPLEFSSQFCIILYFCVLFPRLFGQSSH